MNMQAGWISLQLVKATVILHNFMRWNDHTEPAQVLQNDTPALALQNISRVGSNNSAQGAIAVRETYCTYFSSAAGEVAWQHCVV
ncbi:hypothetical protein SKAU_G00064770 [Synaphobranchus kaupii]|uniref:Uncharacterized protein n=1 Tax=Synaphobranchus kaupii TaxID=118154 RepID=A0A9Q1G6L8_SYNKA|nr:hypothetical protein SKAU_G00064770 [Synaphobranchus kaupii]